MHYLESLRCATTRRRPSHCRQQSLRQSLNLSAASGVADLREVSRQTIRDYQAGAHAPATPLHTRACPSHQSLRRFFAHLENTDAILLNPSVGVPLPNVPAACPSAC